MSLPGNRARVAAGDLGLLRRPAAHASIGQGEANTLVAAGLTIGAGLLWWRSLGAIDPERISDVGLITALPLLSFAALGLLAAGFVVALNGRTLRQPLLAVNVVLLVLMLHGVTSAIQEVPRFATTYVHAGFGEAIMRTGELLVNRDARFSWPLFFVLGAFLTSIAGLDNPIRLADWIPAISNLLYLVPLWLIFRAFTVDRRLIWLAVWFFVAGNWVGQDYYSPQGFNILLTLTILAILLTWFRSREPVPLSGLGSRLRRLIGSPHPDGIAEADDAGVPAVSAGARAGLVLILVLLSVVVVASHQLTPFALLGSTGVLVVTRQTVLRGFPILVWVLLATWLSYMTLAFLAGHINSLLAEALQAEAVATSVGDRLRGTPGHLFIVYERIAFSAAFWGIAFLGGVRRLWNGHWDLALGLLALGPFVFLALQSYGGEMLLRVYLFALPFMSFFVAGLFYPRLRPVSKWQPLLLLALSGALIVGFLFARYGNDRADAITADELAAADRAHAVVAPNSLIATANHNSPLGYRGYDSYIRIGIGAALVTHSVDQVVDALSVRAEGRPTYLFLTQSQRAYFDLNGFPGQEWDLLLLKIESSSSFRLVFRTRDAVLYEFVDGSATGAP